jgi:signal peptidase II
MLAICIILADQLSKAWFVFRLGSLHQYKNFGTFLAHYLVEWNSSLYPNFSILKERYYTEYNMHPIHVYGDWIEFYLTTNKGAAWSMFDKSSLILSFVSFVIAALLWWVWRRNLVYHKDMTLAIGLIIGGALGNFLDRFRLQEVVDFIFVRIPYIGKIFPGLGDPYNFPIFNIADASAVCGTIMLAGYLLWLDITAGKRKRLKQEREHQELNRAFKPYEPRDADAVERAHNVDTSAVQPWESSENAIVSEQESVSMERADETVREEVDSQLPELTADYQPTNSEIEITRQERSGEESDNDVTV